MVADDSKYSDTFERWRERVENSPRRHRYLDLKTFESRDSSSIRLWTNKYEFDLRGGRHFFSSAVQLLTSVSGRSQTVDGVGDRRS
jgi:hypothetical protein